MFSMAQLAKTNSRPTTLRLCSSQESRIVLLRRSSMSWRVRPRQNVWWVCYVLFLLSGLCLIASELGNLVISLFTPSFDQVSPFGSWNRDLVLEQIAAKTKNDLGELCRAWSISCAQTRMYQNIGYQTLVGIVLELYKNARKISTRSLKETWITKAIHPQTRQSHAPQSEFCLPPMQRGCASLNQKMKPSRWTKNLLIIPGFGKLFTAKSWFLLMSKLQTMIQPRPRSPWWHIRSPTQMPDLVFPATGWAAWVGPLLRVAGRRKLCTWLEGGGIVRLL